MAKALSLLKRADKAGPFCDPECEGRCRECPDELIRDMKAEIGRLAAKPADDPERASKDAKLAVEVREGMIEKCANIALAIDSGRGNEKEIAKAIRALSSTGERKP